MVEYLPRSAWNARPPNAGPGNLTVSRVEGAVIHWPGTGSTSVIHSQAAVASALRGWQDYHMDTRGWSDIAYQVAVDQSGRAWTLRGLRTQSGANGNNDVNERYGVSERMKWVMPRSRYLLRDLATSSGEPTSQVVPAPPPP